LKGAKGADEDIQLSVIDLIREGGGGGGGRKVEGGMRGFQTGTKEEVEGGRFLRQPLNRTTHIYVCS
jgi:hypothetical protein